MCLAVFAFTDGVQFDLLAGQLRFLTPKVRHRVFEQAEATSTRASQFGSTVALASRAGGVRIATVGHPTSAVEGFSGRRGLPVTVAIVSGNLGSRSSWIAGHAHESVMHTLGRTTHSDSYPAPVTRFARSLQEPSTLGDTLAALRTELPVLEDFYTGVLRSAARIRDESPEAAPATSILVRDLVARTRPFRSPLEGRFITFSQWSPAVQVTLTTTPGQAVQITKVRLT
jgi:hypothetical protein